MDTKINRNSKIRFGLLAVALSAAALAAASGCVALEAEDLEAIEPWEEEAQGTVTQALESLPCPANLVHRRGDNEEEVFCYCDSAATSAGTVWGTDLYTDDSALCRAAVHAGAITTMGGAIKVTIKPGSPNYFGTTRHGVTSSSYGAWPGSYVVNPADSSAPSVERRYVPMAFYASMQGPTATTSNDTAWRTSFTIHNPSPVSQSIVVTAYDYAGVSYWRPSVALPAGGSTSFQLNGGNVPEGFEGAVLLEGSSTFEVTTVHVPVRSSVLNRPVVNAASRPTSALHFPMVMANFGNRSTKLYFWNTRSSSDVLNLRFHDASGALSCILRLGLGPRAVWELDLVTFGCPNSWTGALSVQTDSPNGQIVGSSMLVDTAGPRVSAHEGIPVGGVPFFPSVLRSYTGGNAPTYSSSLAFQNLSDAASSFLVRFAERDSLQEWLESVPLTARGRQVVETRSSAQLPAGFIGSASLYNGLYAQQGIAALSTVTRDDGGVSFEAVSPAIYASDGAGTRISLPYVRWATAAFSDTQPRTSIAIQNLDDVEVTVWVRYMDASGAQVCGPETCEHELVIGPHQKKNSSPADIGLLEFGYSPTFGGSAIVETVSGSGNLGLGVLVRMFGPTMGEDYTGIPIPL